VSFEIWGYVLAWCVAAVGAMCLARAAGCAERAAERLAEREPRPHPVAMPEKVGLWFDPHHYCPARDCAECHAVLAQLATLFPRLSSAQLVALHARRYAERRALG